MIGGRQVRTQLHVRLVDGLPAGDRRAVEHGAVVQEVVVDQIDVEGDVLHLAADVGEADVDVFDVLFLDQARMSLAVLMSDIPFLSFVSDIRWRRTLDGGWRRSRRCGCA
jgi:hypothetical protein